MVVYNLIDCPIRELPKEGGRFAQLKREMSRLKASGSIRDVVKGIEKEGKYKYFSASAYKQILMFLIQDGYIKQEKE